MTGYDADVHDPMIRRAIRRLLPSLPSYMDADDAMQIGRLGVWRHLATYSGEASGSVVGNVAQRRLIDSIRQAKGRGDTRVRNPYKPAAPYLWSLDMLTGAPEGDGQFYDLLADTQADDPEEMAMRHIDAALAVTALRCLPEREMRVVTMRAADMQFKDIGRALGVSTGRAQQLLEQAKARILRQVAA